MLLVVAALIVSFVVRASRSAVDQTDGTDQATTTPRNYESFDVQDADRTRAVQSAATRMVGTGEPEQIEFGTPLDEAALGDPSGIVYLDVQEIEQMPELPTGCELTSGAMLVNYAGYPVDKVELDRYLPKTRDMVGDGDGVFVDTDDPDVAFIGDTRSARYGVSCNAGPIVTAINSYLATVGSQMQAVDITGETPTQLYARVAAGSPVEVWVTISMSDYGSGRMWTTVTESGKEEVYCTNYHAMVLCGYTEHNVILADPLDTIVVYPKTTFERIYADRGSRAVVIQQPVQPAQTSQDSQQ